MSDINFSRQKIISKEKPVIKTTLKTFQFSFVLLRRSRCFFDGHKPPARANDTKREAEEAQVAAKPVKELLESYESAKSEKIPFSGKKKETEIIALRMKNRKLQRKNDILAKDNGDLYSELKKQEKSATINEGAVKLLKTLLEYAPEELAEAKQTANRRQKQEREQKHYRATSNNKFKGK